MTQSSVAPASEEWHQQIAVRCNNRAWALSVQPRSAEEDREMLDVAHAICAHAASAAGAHDEHRDAYRRAEAAIAAIADEEDRAIVAQTFSQIPAP